MNINTKKESEPFARFITGFLKWAGIALLVGAVGGIMGALFYALVSGAAEFRGKYPNTIFLMPVGGLIIAHLYRINKMSDNGGTNQVISSVRDKDHPPVIIAPLIFVSTAITSLVGGSAGKEGASLQLGGSIGSAVGKLFRLDEKDMSVVVMCGMSAVFSAVFGTPADRCHFHNRGYKRGTAILCCSASLPCFVRYCFAVSAFWNDSRTFFGVAVPVFSVGNTAKIVLLGGLCALLSIAFCISMKATARYIKSLLKNVYIRMILGSLLWWC